MEQQHEIDVQLSNSDIILLLISDYFIDSDYCWGKEMQKALERHRAGEARIIPVILHPVDWAGTPISGLQALPSGAKPITKWRNRDEAFENVAKGIRKVINLLSSQKSIEKGSKFPLPGGLYATRPIYLFWIVDCSSSMGLQGKIHMVNSAIKELLSKMQRTARENTHTTLLLQIIKFSSGAQSHFPKAMSVERVVWTDLKAGGRRDMGEALLKVAEEIAKTVPLRALPPVLVLISDGQPTDDLEYGLQTLLDQPWGRKAVRLAISISEEAQLDVLQKFIANPELHPFIAHNSQEIVHVVEWAENAGKNPSVQT